MRRCWKVGEPAGISIFVHWTFPLLVAMIVAVQFATGASVGATLESVAFVSALFGCIVLHELGHAMAARRYGIRTVDITLLPIGGVARLERMPEDPSQELWVALAGPAVNVLIAIGLFPITRIIDGIAPIVGQFDLGGEFLTKLIEMNLVLAVFNLLPAFPMDGGRVLRALLARRIDYIRATHIAARSGQLIAVMLGLVGLSSNWFLIGVGVFMYAKATQEVGDRERFLPA